MSLRVSAVSPSYFRRELLTRSSPAILPSKEKPLHVTSAVSHTLSHSQDVPRRYSFKKGDKENVPLAAGILLRKATDTLPPPTMASPTEELEFYKRRMSHINLITPHLQLPEEMWPTAYSQATTFHAKLRNRYPNILPADKGLIKLKNRTNPDTDYINASLYSGMIITQGPFISSYADTVADFWMLAFEQPTTSIVCLTDHETKGEEKTNPYWKTLRADGPLVYRKKIKEAFLSVRLIEDAQTVIQGDATEEVVKRSFEITFGDKKKEITQWHYLNWIDQGVCNPQLLAQLIRVVLLERLPVIHCSAGIGRSGVFAVALKCIYTHLIKGVIPTEDMIDQEIIELRHLRATSVQGIKQRKLIYDTIYAFINE